MLQTSPPEIPQFANQKLTPPYIKIVDGMFKYAILKHTPGYACKHDAREHVRQLNPRANEKWYRVIKHKGFYFIYERI